MDRVFFKEFLMISEIKTLIFIAILLFLIIILNKLPKKNFNFSKKVIIGTVLGLLLGLGIQYVAGFPEKPANIEFIKETTTWYSLVGGGFISLIRMLVIPLIMVSIIHVIINMKEDTNLGSLVKKTLTITTIMVAISIVLGLGMAILFDVGKVTSGASLVIEGITEKRGIIPMALTLKNLIPANPVESMVKSNIVGLVIFSAFIGVGAKRMSKKYLEVVEPFFKLINALQKIIISMAMSIIKWMPMAVIPLLANTVAQRGIKAIHETGKFIFVLYLAVGIMMVIQTFAVLAFGLNPIKYLKKSISLMLLAFTSRSSVGCLPVTISTLTNKLGVSESTASFVASFGTTAGMQGCAGIFPAMTLVFVKNMSGETMDITFLIMAVVVITIGSFGIAGIPGTATMAASVTLSGTGMGHAFSLINPILGIDPIVDMPRTMLNVIGAVTNAIMVDKSLGKLNIDMYNDMSIKDEERKEEN